MVVWSLGVQIRFEAANLFVLDFRLHDLGLDRISFCDLGGSIPFLEMARALLATGRCADKTDAGILGG